MLVNAAQLSWLFCNSLLTFCITELCYMLITIVQLSLVISNYSCSFATCLWVLLNFLWWSYITLQALIHALECCPTFFSYLAILFWLFPSQNFVICSWLSFNFRWWYWITPANFATCLQVFLNFLCWSYITPTNFAVCLWVLLDFLWLPCILFWLFASRNFVICLQISFNFSWWS